MKTLIAALLLSLPLSALAGLPSEDPAVAELREQFRNAHTPTLAELKLETLWKCQSRNAIKGYNDVMNGPEYRFGLFSIKDGNTFLVDRELEKLVKNNHVDPSEVSLFWAFNDGNLVGQPYQDPTVSSVHPFARMTADGKLIVEIGSFLPPTLPKSTMERRLSISEPATIFPELRLMGYDICEAVAN